MGPLHRISVFANGNCYVVYYFSVVTKEYIFSSYTQSFQRRLISLFFFFRPAYDSLAVTPDPSARARSSSANNSADLGVTTTSKGVPQNETTRLPRPQTLPTGLVNHPSKEEQSYQESSDNVSLSSASDLPERKKKKRLFPKFGLLKSSDKTKTN